ncbi:terminase [Rhodococcus erythropolis]|uniref:terminase n=1 Tax=Rhodococcus erythropolis TaxID=1833 RepID=UPI001BEC8B28|nr:terminase [Rhodococcus erythropolis]MBT2266447.1 terminase [Rhodococcus erythropolis]
MTKSLLVSDAELLPGYWRDPVTGAWCTLPWPSDEDEKRAIVRSSLGPQVIRWAEWKTDEPGLINPHTGEYWSFTPGQKRFLIMWYAFNDEGRFIYRRGVKRGAKGTGKDPFGASHCNIELLGPSQLVSDGRGGWTGVRHGMPLVQIASNSEDQSKDMMRVANAQLGSEAREHYGLDCAETRTIIKNSGGRLEVLTASERSNEGDPATFIALNESHHMTDSSGGTNLAKVARRNVGKSPRELQARMVEYTNAHESGSDSVAEKSFNAWQKQVSGNYPALNRDILYDSVESDPGLDFYDPEQRGIALDQAYSDAEWADKERLSAEIVDPDTSAADSIRFYLNGLAAAEDAWVDPKAWDVLASDAVVSDGEQVAMFLDCSKSEDATALMLCRISDGFNFVGGVWQRPRGKRGERYLVDRNAVDAVVRSLKDRYNVVWFGVDPSPAKDDSAEALYWAEVIDGWHRDFGKSLTVWASRGHSVKFDMRLSQPGGRERNQQFTEQAQIVVRQVDEEGLDGPLRHDGNASLRLHVHQAKKRGNPWGHSLGKVNRDSDKSVDLAVAMVGANLGRRLALNSGKLRKTGGAMFF